MPNSASGEATERSREKFMFSVHAHAPRYARVMSGLQISQLWRLLRDHLTESHGCKGSYKISAERKIVPKKRSLGKKSVDDPNQKQWKRYVIKLFPFENAGQDQFEGHPVAYLDVIFTELGYRQHGVKRKSDDTLMRVQNPIIDAEEVTSFNLVDHEIGALHDWVDAKVHKFFKPKSAPAVHEGSTLTRSKEDQPVERTIPHQATL